MSFQRIYHNILDAAIISLIVFTPFAFGAVHIWAYTISEIIIFLLLILFAIKYFFFAELFIEKALKPLYIALLLVLLLVVFQLIPLPQNIVRFLSPGIVKYLDVYNNVIPGFSELGSLPLSVYPHATRISLVKLFAWFGIFVIMLQEVKEKERIQKYILLILAVAFLEALYGLFAYFSKSDSILWYKRVMGWSRASGTFVNSNHFVFYLSICGLLGLGYFLSFFREKSKGRINLKYLIIDFLDSSKSFKQVMILIMLLTIFLGIIFSLSRMGIFSFIIAVLFMIFFLLVKGQKKARNIIAVFFLLGVILSLWYGVMPLEERIYYTVERRVDSRTEVWKATLALIRDFPVVGSGMGTYENIFRHYQPENIGIVIFAQAHNDYLDLLSNLGILGFIFVISGIGYFLYLLVLFRGRRKNPFSKGVAFGGSAVILYAALHSLADFNLQIPANAINLLIIMALAFNSTKIVSLQEPGKRLLKPGSRDSR